MPFAPGCRRPWANAVPLIAPRRQIEFDHLGAGGQNLIGSFVEEVFRGQIVFAINVRDAKHVRRVVFGDRTG